MNSTEPLKWFWQRFMIESKLPKDRFNMIFDGNEMSAIPDNNNMTREEYRFSLFINQIRDIYQEIVIKPTWLQFSLHNPEFAGNDVIKNSLGLDFVEENIFKLGKENAVLQISSQIIQTLSGLNGADGKPVFPMKYLCQKYLNINDDEWKLIDKMKKQEDEEAQNSVTQGGEGSDTGFGTGSEFGFGGGESGGFGEDTGGGFESEPEQTPEPEMSTEPEQTPEPTI